MSQENHEHRHHFHHHKEEEKQNLTPYEKAMKDEKKHKRMEHLGELEAVAAGTFALYEKHQAKKNPESAQRHKIEEIAATAAVGAGVYVFHEHHKKKESKKQVKQSHGK